MRRSGPLRPDAEPAQDETITGGAKDSGGRVLRIRGF